MSVLLDANTRLLVQGIGTEGANHMRRSIAYGTNVVGAIHPKRGGEQQDGVPIFSTVAGAVRETGANVSIIFVPAPGAKDAILEAMSAGLPLVVCITEGIPVLDMIAVKAAFNGSKSILIGPNCPGVITPSTKTRVGIMPGDVFLDGSVGVVSRSGTLVYEVVAQLTAEKAVRKWVKNRGTVREWIKIRERNEALDLEVYCLAALYILGPAFVKSLPERVAALARKLQPSTQESAESSAPAVTRRRGWVDGWRG